MNFDADAISCPVCRGRVFTLYWVGDPKYPLAAREIVANCHQCGVMRKVVDI